METKKGLTGKEKFAYGIGAVGKDMVYMLSALSILVTPPIHPNCLKSSACGDDMKSCLLTPNSVRRWQQLCPELDVCAAVALTIVSPVRTWGMCQRSRPRVCTQWDYSQSRWRWRYLALWPLESRKYVFLVS